MSDAQKLNIPGATVRMPVVSKTGAQYRVLVTSHINGRVVNAGEVVEYDGVPGRYLQPLNAEAEKAKKQADSIRADATDAHIRTVETSGAAAAQRKLRAMDNDRRGVDAAAALAVSLDNSGNAPSASERRELEKQAEASKAADLSQQQDAGGRLVQMSGTSPETVVPTTGPGAHATSAQMQAAEALAAEGARTGKATRRAPAKAPVAKKAAARKAAKKSGKK